MLVSTATTITTIIMKQERRKITMPSPHKIMKSTEVQNPQRGFITHALIYYTFYTCRIHARLHIIIYTHALTLRTCNGTVYGKVHVGQNGRQITLQLFEKTPFYFTAHVMLMLLVSLVGCVIARDGSLELTYRASTVTIAMHTCRGIII